jgi:hypothetical protein
MTNRNREALRPIVRETFMLLASLSEYHMRECDCQELPDKAEALDPARLAYPGEMR